MNDDRKHAPLNEAVSLGDLMARIEHNKRLDAELTHGNTLAAETSGAWIELINGDTFDALMPTPSALTAEVIARGLSMKCRYNGQVENFYSTAEHSVLLALCMSRGDPVLRLNALLHDAEDSVLPDIPTPYKNTICRGMKEIEERVRRAAHRALGVPYRSDRGLLKRFDRLIVLTERAHLMPYHNPENRWEIDDMEYDAREYAILRELPVRCLAHEAAEELWLKCYKRWKADADLQD